MSSHCGRYPGCGCTSHIGTKCHLPADDPRLKEKELDYSSSSPEYIEAKRKLEDDDKDWQGINNIRISKHRKPTKYTLKKKRRKK